jgi:predicted TIM-barrel fold metal-dependent hydrolase
MDVHAHYLPGFYREALAEAGQLQPDGIRALPAWDVQAALRTMDQLAVATALLSISSPGVHFGNDEKAQQLARRVNEEGKRLVDAHPDRFGYFASLPLPDVDGAVTEAIYALEVLGADGVVLETNSHGMYLGDPKLEPLYAELNKRSAVIFVHPTTPAGSCCERLAANYPQPVMEFMFDMTRSITDMIFSGVLERHPNVRVIVPHAGAALAALSDRIELLMPTLAAPTAKPRPSFLKTLRHLHFDLAGAPVPHLLGPLLQVADHDRLHYGSDYPFTPASACDALAKRIETTPLIDDGLRQKIWRDNTVALFPRLGSTLNKTGAD